MKAPPDDSGTEYKQKITEKAVNNNDFIVVRLMIKPTSTSILLLLIGLQLITISSNYNSILFKRQVARENFDATKFFESMIECVNFLCEVDLSVLRVLEAMECRLL